MKKVQTPVHPCFDCCQTVFQKKSHNNYCLAPTLPHEHKRGLICCMWNVVLWPRQIITLRHCWETQIKLAHACARVDLENYAYLWRSSGYPLDIHVSNTIVDDFFPSGLDWPELVYTLEKRELLTCNCKGAVVKNTSQFSKHISGNHLPFSTCLNHQVD